MLFRSRNLAALILQHGTFDHKDPDKEYLLALADELAKAVTCSLGPDHPSGHCLDALGRADEGTGACRAQAALGRAAGTCTARGGVTRYGVPGVRSGTTAPL